MNTSIEPDILGPAEYSAARPYSSEPPSRCGAAVSGVRH
jgi:hypothetical protein